MTIIGIDPGSTHSGGHMTIIGIDPGSTHSGVCIIGPGKTEHPNILRAEKVANDDLLQMVFNRVGFFEIALEDLVSYTHGRHIDLTQRSIGHIELRAKDYGVPLNLYKRREYGQWITAGGKISDATLRAGLESIYGPSAKKGDPLYLLRGATDKRSAFAVAKYHEFMATKVAVAGGA